MLIAFCPVFASARLAAQDVAPRVVQTQPDAAYQAALADVAAAPDRAGMDAAVSRVVSMNEGNLARLVPQLVWHAAKRPPSASAPSVVGHVFKRLADVKHGVVAALAPLLDDADTAIREVTRDLLRGYEDRSALRPPDFSAYHAILEADVRGGRPLQASLIAHMYASDSGAALLTVMRATQLRKPEEIKPILWAEHVVADLMWRRQFGFAEKNAVDPAAVRELDKLSQHKAWWARLYAAEIIRVHPELGSQAMHDRLKKDVNVVVQQAAGKG